MSIKLYNGDLPSREKFGSAVAIDTETMGLNIKRDRLCLVQISKGDGNAILVQLAPGQCEAPNLCALLKDPGITKIFHFGRFDMAALFYTFKAMPSPIYCTKIASKIARTYTDTHGLKVLVRELLGIEINKQQQSSYWGSDNLNDSQLKYAANDAIYLHGLRDKLDHILKREGRAHLVKACFNFLPHRVLLDITGWNDCDIFAHS